MGSAGSEASGTSAALGGGELQGRTAGADVLPEGSAGPGSDDRRSGQGGRRNRRTGSVPGKRGGSADAGVLEKAVALRWVRFNGQQPWPGERGERGSYQFEVGHDGVEELELADVGGVAVIRVSREPHVAYYPVANVGYFMLAD